MPGTFTDQSVNQSSLSKIKLELKIYARAIVKML